MAALCNLKQRVQRFTAFSVKKSLCDCHLITAEQHPSFPATVTQNSKRTVTRASYAISEELPLHWILHTKNHAVPGSPCNFAVSPAIKESWRLYKQFVFSFLTMLNLPVLWKTFLHQALFLSIRECMGGIFDLKKQKYITHSDEACSHFGLSFLFVSVL